MAGTRFYSLISLLLAPVAATQMAQAQVVAAPPTIGAGSCGRDSTGLGRIVGRLVADSSGAQPGQIQILVKGACPLRADMAGAFTIRGLPPGDYSLAVASFQLSAVGPPSVHVVAESTSTVTIHLRPSNRIDACRLLPACAALIAPAAPAMIAGLSEADRVREVALRTAIMLLRSLGGVPAGVPMPTRGYCLAGETLTMPATPAVVDAVRRIFPTAVPVNECGPPPRGRAGGTRVIATGDRAGFFTVSKIVIDGEHASVAAMGDGTFWACVLERTPAGWGVTSCKVTGIS